MNINVLTPKHLDGIEKRLTDLEQRWRETAPLYSGDVLTDDDLVKMLKVSRRTLSTYRKEGVITYTQVGKMIWYTKMDVLNFLTKHRNEQN